MILPADTGARPSVVDSLPVLTSALLAAQPGIRHGITRRRQRLGAAGGNMSYSGQRDRAAAWTARQHWCAAIGVDPAQLVTTGQVHGNEVLRIRAHHAGAGAAPESAHAGIADALITNERGPVLLSMHADCLPVLVYDPATPAVGVIHAGWRGTVANVVATTIAAMVDTFGTDPGRVLAFLGPAIAGGCYEVGDEVARAWRATAGAGDPSGALQPAGGRWTFDIARANAGLLRQAGLRAEHIEASGICTRCGGDDWFSHRGQGPTTGRFGAIIALTGD